MKETVGRSSIFREGKQCLANSPEISRIIFILLFYFIIKFLKVFLTEAYPDSIRLTIKTEVLGELCFDYFNVVCATSKATDQPAHIRSLIRAFASCLKNFTLQ